MATRSKGEGNVRVPVRDHVPRLVVGEYDQGRHGPTVLGSRERTKQHDIAMFVPASFLGTASRCLSQPAPLGASLQQLQVQEPSKQRQADAIS